MSELKPCPWCEAPAHEQEWTTFNGPRECVEVQCDGCERSVRCIDAIDAWNALPRQSQAAPSDREKWLEEALNRWQSLFRDSDMRPEDECNECYDFAEAALADTTTNNNDATKK